MGGSLYQMIAIIHGSNPGNYPLLRKTNLASSASKHSFSLPVQDPSAHLADYACCLLKEGLLWSLKRDPVGICNISGLESSTHHRHKTQASAYVDLETLRNLSEADRVLICRRYNMLRNEAFPDERRTSWSWPRDH